MQRHLIIALAFILTCTANAGAQATQSADPTARTTTRPATTREGKEDKSGDHIFVTTHSTAVAGRTIDYTATAGTMAQKDETGKPLADMFFVAYTRTSDSATRPASRPVTFVFNGGPGAASVWLHLGTAGPKRINLPETGVAAS